MSDRFIAEAASIYEAANAATLSWMLDRPPLMGAFLDTKVNSLTLADYSPADGRRGPGYTYGWIQGRGLEALATHAAFFTGRDDALVERLDARASLLYQRLAAMTRDAGHGYFCYGPDMAPVWFDAAGGQHAQDRPEDIFTYSDAFIAKGLVAAAARHAPQDLPHHLAYLDAVIAAIEDGRFQMDENRPLSPEAARGQPDDFGPRMILLGAAGLISRIGLPACAGFAERFIDHVLARHRDPASGLLANVPGEDVCNVGHAIEFVGFALEHVGRSAPAELAATLQDVLMASFRHGFVGPGIALAVSMASGRQLSPYCPWWSLPEAIRAAAQCHALSGSPEALSIWRDAHEAFFTRYWRQAPPIAYQTLTADGPVDYVPATPDLDPAYHTGLSLLGAIRAAQVCQPRL